jgi:hypothetical protein
MVNFMPSNKSISKMRRLPVILLLLTLIENVNAVCKRIAKLILRIPPSLIEIHKRAELAMPLLVFISEVL